MIESGKKMQRAARDARLAAALRENLKRRKAQARARAGATAPSREPQPEAAPPRNGKNTGWRE
jgi:hypothetical protein